ncbi:hypothetical protein PYW08_009148 [Mythimna loreyi]|uniref:Uncharacterized protein n=1 Tax=Mythimna loreyi TaxID=667449 RepID=A0ACC2QA92_9NEOP|nr:hypothetical protein PYW08_009148 [Mythimna loreyi]
MNPNPSSSQPKVEGETALASITVSSRIPEFWADQPRLWFAQFEATVEGQRLGDAAKQNLVITKLNKTAIQQISDLLLTPPETQKYQTLKERLLQVFEESETRQFQKLLSEMELGTQKPSQLIRRMRDLARGKIPDQTLQIMWNSHLPSAVQAVLAVTEAKDLDNLAIIADKVMEATRPSEVASVATGAAPTAPKDTSVTGDLASIVAKLSIEVAELRRSRQSHRSGGRDRSGSRFRSKSRNRNDNRKRHDAKWLCFYHYRYGAKAAKCVEPCNWKAAPPAPSEN